MNPEPMNSKNLFATHSRPAIPALLICGMMLVTRLAPADPPLNLTLTDRLTLQPSASTSGMNLYSSGCFRSMVPRTDDTPLLSQLISQNTSAVFLWDSGRTALRAGLFSGARIEPWNMGTASTAFGFETEAYAMSIAGGAYSKAYGSGSLAMGQLAITGGGWSCALGDNTSALASWSFAAGGFVTACGHASAGLNAYNLAAGDYSFAAGLWTRADAINSFVIGRSNVGGGGTQWNLADPIFEIGIGDSPFEVWPPVRKNALTVYKDGRITIPKRQGDILMGEFGNPGD